MSIVKRLCETLSPFRYVSFVLVMFDDCISKSTALYILCPILSYDKKERLFNSMAEHIQGEDESVPERVDDYLYYTRTAAGEAMPMYCRRRVDGTGTYAYIYSVF